MYSPTMAESQLLKKDLFGEIWQISAGEQFHIVRDAGTASVYVRWLARRLLHREARVLAAMDAIETSVRFNARRCVSVIARASAPMNKDLHQDDKSP